MYEPGNIYYFKPFIFSNGNSKPKYFLSLYCDKDAVIVATLPSSVDYVPSYLEKKHGCLNDLPSDFNAYYCSPGVKIATNGWCFPTHTYLYGMWVNTYTLKDLEANYQVEGVDYDFIGRLIKDEFDAIVRCFLSARTIKNKVKRLLQKTSYE